MCTRVFLADNPVAKVAGRTLDLSFVDEPRLWWLPAGLTRRGHPTDETLTWTSQYPSMVITEWGGECLDGINGMGLAAHALMYTSAGYEPADERPTLATAAWVSYILDNFATVAEAVLHLSAVRVAPVPIRDLDIGVHVAIEDADGDSAIFEPIDGEMVVHHGRQYQIMANSPSLDEQLQNLARYRPFGGELPPPGDITSADRFVRASYFHHFLPEPDDPRMAVAEVLQVLTTVAKPLGAPYPEGDIYPTRWLSAVDLTDLDYYFWSRTSPSLVWASMSDFDDVTGPRSVPLLDENLAGGIADAMLPTPPPA
ncbi:MAG: linear amide C-N hydrolase [Candidatus Nanopelagicales bacterium]